MRRRGGNGDVKERRAIPAGEESILLPRGDGGKRHGGVE